MPSFASTPRGFVPALALFASILSCGGAPSSLPKGAHTTPHDGAQESACKKDVPSTCKAACDAGNGKACYELAAAIRDNRVSRAQFGSLVDRLKEAANHGVPEAYLELARVYAVGLAVVEGSAVTESVEADPDLATSFARMGCDAGLGAACYQEGLLLESAQTPDTERARKAFRAASERGEPMGHAALARMAAAEKTPIPAPPIRCPDSIVGKWVGQVLASHTTTQWYEFRLYIRRQGTEPLLFGEIVVDYWSGPIIESDKRHVVMSAHGEATTSSKGMARFDGASFRSAHTSYVLDLFSGELEGNLFVAKDEDGTNMRFPGIDRIAFVRVGCDSTPPADPAVQN